MRGEPRPEHHGGAEIELVVADDTLQDRRRAPSSHARKRAGASAPGRRLAHQASRETSAWRRVHAPRRSRKSRRTGPSRSQWIAGEMASTGRRLMTQRARSTGMSKPRPL